MANDKIPPPILWAERNDKIYLTINVGDLRDVSVKFEDKKCSFSAKGADKKEYEVVLDFKKEINPSESTYAVLPRHIPMIVVKKESGPYWGKLLDTTKKMHWLKTDFNKWRDEDDSDYDEAEDMQFENMMQKMGNFNTQDTALPPEEEEDSDDEDLPDLA